MLFIACPVRTTINQYFFFKNDIIVDYFSIDPVCYTKGCIRSLKAYLVAPFPHILIAAPSATQYKMSKHR